MDKRKDKDSKQLCFFFQKMQEEKNIMDNIIRIDQKRQARNKSVKRNSRNEILVKFIRHSEKLDW